ncbi:HAD family hydrolase [Nocardioides sp.]|uniref:HAD family hydrolase n=1 Tax=Nocardioides sp. TaxID=35761 RepID=UPI0039E63756
MSQALVDAVLFDYGGVLTVPPRVSLAAWQEQDGIDPRSFSAALKQWLSRDVDWVTPIHQLETGEVSGAEFEALLAAELRTIDGRPIQVEGLLSRMFALMKPDEEMFALVETLRRSGLKVGLLSNSWGNTYPRPRIDELFDPVVISSELGLRKPQAEIYQRALDGLAVPADRVLFVDDGEPNILGARRAGLRALLHTDPRSTTQALAAMVPGLLGPV